MSEGQAIEKGLSEGQAIEKGLSEVQAIEKGLSEGQAIEKCLSEVQAIEKHELNSTIKGCVQVRELTSPRCSNRASHGRELTFQLYF